MTQERGIRYERGPYVQVACFCETVVQGNDGTLTLVRIIDHLTHTAAGPEPPAEMPPVTHRMKMVLALKSGEARGRHELQTRPDPPSRELGPPAITTSVLFEGEHRGINIIGDMTYTFSLEGLYWFRVYLDGLLLTAIPFRVDYQRIATGAIPPPGSR